MYARKKSSYRSLAFSMIILSLILLVAAMDGPVIFARLAPQPDTLPNYVANTIIAKPTDASPLDISRPALQTTPSNGDIYLPIIMYSPAASAPTGCNPTGGSGGLKPGTYETTVAGLNAILIVGQGYDPNKPTYLSFYVHGNSGGYTWYKSLSNPVNKFVNKHNWIFVAPKSPRGTSWSKDWDNSLNEAFIKVLEEMFAKYNVCRDILIGSSISGGAIFWTGYFFPEEGSKYPAHISLLCGGLNGHDKASRQKVMDLGQNNDVVAKSTFDYTYGTADYLYDYIVGSIQLYTDAGFNVKTSVLPGAGHCADGFPSIFTVIVDDWEERIQELNLE